MNIRRILYIALIVFIALFAYKSIQDDALTSHQVPGKLSREEVLESFSSGLIDCGDEQKTISAIYFTNKYAGKDGEVFYVLIQNADELITCKYRIEETAEDSDETRMGFNLEQTWDGIKLPASKFDVYHLEDNEGKRDIPT